MPTPGAAAGSEAGRPVPPVFAELFDDAGIFPPASLSVADALRQNTGHIGSWYARTVGLFVCSDARLPELFAALDDLDRPLELALTVPGGAGDVGRSVQQALSDRRVFLRGVEVPAGDSVDAAVDALDAALPAGVEGYVEVPWRVGVNGAIGRIGKAGLRAKFRTGGTTLGSVPSATSLGHAIRSCATAGVPFKLTAGLHSAVAYRDPSTGVDHHGFLNVMLAAYAAINDADGEACARLLGERDVSAAFRGLPADQAADVRGLFVSFGTCSVDEPVADLVRLGLLEQP